MNKVTLVLEIHQGHFENQNASLISVLYEL